VLFGSDLLAILIGSQTSIIFPPFLPNTDRYVKKKLLRARVPHWAIGRRIRRAMSGRF
jgi:hypothetical protein